MLLLEIITYLRYSNKRKGFFTQVEFYCFHIRFYFTEMVSMLAREKLMMKVGSMVVVVVVVVEVRHGQANRLRDCQHKEYWRRMC
jgi:uncharacterized membrane protein